MMNQSISTQILCFTRRKTTTLGCLFVHMQRVFSPNCDPFPQYVAQCICANIKPVLVLQRFNELPSLPVNMKSGSEKCLDLFSIKPVHPSPQGEKCTHIPHIHTHTYIHTHIHPHIHTYTYTHIHTHIHTYTLHIHTLHTTHSVYTHIPTQFSLILNLPDTSVL